MVWLISNWIFAGFELRSLEWSVSTMTTWPPPQNVVVISDIFFTLKNLSILLEVDVTILQRVVKIRRGQNNVKIVNIVWCQSCYIEWRSCVTICRRRRFMRRCFCRPIVITLRRFDRLFVIESHVKAQDVKPIHCQTGVTFDRIFFKINFYEFSHFVTGEFNIPNLKNFNINKKPRKCIQFSFELWGEFLLFNFFTWMCW